MNPICTISCSIIDYWARSLTKVEIVDGLRQLDLASIILWIVFSTAANFVESYIELSVHLLNNHLLAFSIDWLFLRLVDLSFFRLKFFLPSKSIFVQNIFNWLVPLQVFWFLIYCRMKTPLVGLWHFTHIVTSVLTQIPSLLSRNCLEVLPFIEGKLLSVFWLWASTVLILQHLLWLLIYIRCSYSGGHLWLNMLFLSLA